MKSQEKFSWKKRGKSFIYAFQGITHAFKTQHNLWIHLSIASVVIICGFIFNLSITRWCIILFAIGFVIVTELINTALEKIVDFISPEYNEKAGIIKDIGAVAVLISSLFAAITGLIIKII